MWISNRQLLFYSTFKENDIKIMLRYLQYMPIFRVNTTSKNVSQKVLWWSCKFDSCPSRTSWYRHALPCCFSSNRALQVPLPWLADMACWFYFENAYTFQNIFHQTYGLLTITQVDHPPITGKKRTAYATAVAVAATTAALQRWNTKHPTRVNAISQQGL